MPENTKSTRRVRPKANPPLTAPPPEASTQSEVPGASAPIMDLREILEYLTSVKRTPAGAVVASSELCQHVKITPKGAENSMPDKRACVELAARLQGLFPDKTRLDAPGSAPGQVILSEERRQELIEKKRAATLRLMEEGA